MSAKAALSDEELCERIRRYWHGVRGGRAVEVWVAAGKPYTLPSGAQATPRVIVSNTKAGLPPGVSSQDVRRAGKGL